MPLPPVDQGRPYARYADTPSGISPPAFYGHPGAIVKVDSYVHDESGITSEEATVTARMTEKRQRKEKTLKEAAARYQQVDVSGKRDATTAILCWGSTKGVCTEVGTSLGVRVVRPVVLSPFPGGPLRDALAGVTRLIAVEENASTQLADIARGYGFPVQKTILRYDGRPFTPDDLAGRIREVL